MAPRKGRLVLLGVLGGTALTSLAGLGSSTLIKSPQQVAAESAPPSRSVLTSEVVLRQLRRTIVLRGTTAAKASVTVQASPPEGSKAVITKLPVHAGSKVRAGTVVVEISGRPVIVLHGRFPAYRDVHAGDSGPDVLELQHALGELGLSTGANSGVFNAATARALKTLYTRLGYRPPGERVSTTPTASPATGPGSGQAKMLLPASEVVYIPDTSAIVDDLQARVGKESKGTVMSLASGGLNVRALLSPEDRPLVSIGQSVQISSDQSGTTRSGRISAIGHYTSGTPDSPQITPAPGSNPAASGLTEGSGNSGHPLTVRPKKTLPPDWIGQDLKLTITTASTSGKVLAVPVSAVYGSADSATKVIKLLPNGSQKRIDVRTGASADGMVEVIAAGNALRPGDRVVVGR